MDFYNKTIARLIMDNNYRFYGYFLLSAHVIYTKSVPTAGVSVTNQINLYINPDFFATLSNKQQEEVLMHEAQHLYNNHIARFKEFANGPEDHELFNIATDAEINSPLKTLHEFGVTEDKIIKELRGMLPDETIKENMIAEYYFEKFKQIRNNMSKKMQDLIDSGKLGKSNGHGKWKESTDNGSLSKALISSAMKKSIQKSGGIGNVPRDVAIAFENINKSLINWKSQLRQFFARVHKFDREITRKRRNRRYGVLVAGKKKKPQCHIAIGVDESGSVSQDQWEQFYAEIKAINNTGDVKLTVITCDTEVGQIYDFNSKKKITRTKGGGTNYQPVLDAAKELNIDGLVFFQDNGCFDHPNKPKYPVLWATIDGNGKITDKHCFGREIIIK